MFLCGCQVVTCVTMVTGHINYVSSWLKSECSGVKVDCEIGSVSYQPAQGNCKLNKRNKAKFINSKYYTCQVSFI